MTRPDSPNNFYSGISGLVLPMPKYKFPEGFQKSSRLTYYASILISIEINRSFYALPREKTVAKWAAEVPEDFRFTFKLWNSITHAKGLEFQELDVRNFITVINAVGDKKGCLLIQFPASVKVDRLSQLQYLLETIQVYNGRGAWKIAIEFRDRSWYHPDTYDIVQSLGGTIVIHDKSRAGHTDITAPFGTVYLRFHGPLGDYRGSYSDSFLYEYAAYIREWLADGKSVFTYFNNTMGSAFENLMTLNKFVRDLH